MSELSSWLKSLIRLRQIKERLLKSAKYASPLEVERAEQIFYINYLQEGMTVFDVGANVGELSLLFSRFVGGGGKIHAFEASSSAFAKLVKVFEATGRKQVILNHKAVAHMTGTVRLHVYDDEHLSWSSMADRPLQNYGIDIKSTHVEEVESVTIDDYCRENNIARIDLLKIDVEGAELQVLLGARNMLQEKRIRCCVFEFGSTTFDMGNSPDEIETFLKGSGYTIFNLVKNEPVFPGRSSAEQARFSIHIAQPRNNKPLWNDLR
jgi:FkbM family methyltransferase